MNIKVLSTKLYDIGAIQIDFTKGWTLKSGLWSPIYINLRLLQSYPTMLENIAAMMEIKMKKQKIVCDCIASIPLGALPLGIALSLQTKKPHITPRMAKKDHGITAAVDGVFQKNQTALVVDDLITRATSKEAAIHDLEDVGLMIKDVLVVLDREQGGVKELESKGYRVHTLCTLTEVLRELVKGKRITKVVEARIHEYLKNPEKGKTSV